MRESTTLRLLTVLAALGMLLLFSNARGARAEVTWTLSDAGKLTVSGTGAIPDNAFEENYDITSVVIKSGVTAIGANAFDSCYSLKTVTIPDTVTSIGSSAFYWCSELTSVTIPSSVTRVEDSTFAHCEALKTAAIPETVTYIGQSAFQYCESLTGITVPNGVTEMGQYVFMGCTSLKTAALSTSLENVPFEAFYGCTSLTSVTIPASVSEIVMYSFRECNSLASLTIKNGVTKIGGSAFAGCSSLTKVTIPASVNEIALYAFDACTSLATVMVDPGNGTFSSLDGILYDKYRTRLIFSPEGITGSRVLPDTLTSIGKQAFYNCSGLVELTIPNTVQKMGGDVFLNCSNVTCVVEEGSYAETYCADNGVAYTTVPATGDVVSYSLSDDGTLTVRGNGDIADSLFLNNKDIRNVVIKSGITGIGDRCFDQCVNLASVSIPSTVTEIGESAFRDTALTSVTVPAGVTKLGDGCFTGCEQLASVTLSGGKGKLAYTFEGCTSLRQVTIPNGVTELYATFKNCTALEKVILPDTVTVINQETFNGCSSLKSFNMPKYLECLKGYAVFKGCASLPDTLVFPEGFVQFYHYENFTGSSIRMIQLPTTMNMDPDAFAEAMQFIRNTSSAAWGISDVNISVMRMNNIHFLLPRGSDFTWLVQNQCFEIENYSLYDAGAQVSPASTLTLPASTRTVGTEAFIGVKATVIRIPYGCTTISARAFANITSLDTVYIPESVTSIAASAFDGCGDFTIICPEGSYAEGFAEDHGYDHDFIG